MNATRWRETVSQRGATRRRVMATSLALAILGAGALGLIPVGAATAREMQCVAAVVPVRPGG
jgi:hypothetical protein